MQYIVVNNSDKHIVLNAANKDQIIGNMVFGQVGDVVDYRSFVFQNTILEMNENNPRYGNVTNFHTSYLIKIPDNADMIQTNGIYDAQYSEGVWFYSGIRYFDASRQWVSDDPYNRFTKYPQISKIPEGAAYVQFCWSYVDQKITPTAVFINTADPDTSQHNLLMHIGDKEPIEAGNVYGCIHNNPVFAKWTSLSYRFLNEYAHYKTYAITNDSASTVRGTLLKVRTIIHVFTPDSYTSVEQKPWFTFLVGRYDQHKLFVEKHRFYLRLHNDVNEVDVSSLNIPIEIGDQVAISVLGRSDKFPEDVEGSFYCAGIVLGHNSEHIQHEILYGTKNNQFLPLEIEFGGTIDLSYSVAPSSVNATDTIANSNAIISLQQQINEQMYVKDDLGNQYEIKVDTDGHLYTQKIGYKKALCLGNSLTSHGYAPNIGYYGDEPWAMASTNKVATTWSEHLRSIISQKYSSAIATPYNIFAWETNVMGADLDELFSDYVGQGYDLVIFRAGENGSAGSDYTAGVRRLFTYLKTNFSDADIIITDLFWHDTTKETVYMTVAEELNLRYMSSGSIADTCLLGQMLMGMDDVMHPVVHSGVAGHCTDVCFYDFANLLASFLGYNQLNKKHIVTVNTSSQYKINNTYQIANGYVSVLTYSSNAPTMTVTSSSGGQIQCQNFSMANVSWIATPSPIPTFSTVFMMPDKDVTVSF